jgi:hypothetical protein
MNNITGTIINDCVDDLARLRQQTYFNRLFGTLPAFAGVGNELPDLEAAGTLIDALDVLGNFPFAHANGLEAVVIVNVAPRGGNTKLWGDNGTPFCYFYVGKVLVVSTLAGECLSLVKKLGIAHSVQAVEVSAVTNAAVGWGDLTQTQATKITNSQFRSLEFLPLLAYWLANGKEVPSKTIELPDSPVAANNVWQIDNFGNAKTTLLTKDVGFAQGKKLILADGTEVVCYERLTDVPKDCSAITIGSSGYGKDRFLEVVVQWRDGGRAASDSAKQRHGLKPGSQVIKDDLLQLQGGK